MNSSRQKPPEPIGKRVARLRAEQGWTQQALSQRLAISRVAISHIEIDLTIPSERTITLLAGIFKVTPHALVDGTTYPLAKAEKLPPITCSFTPLELDLALMENDLAWLKCLEGVSARGEYASRVREHWQKRLAHWSRCDLDPAEFEHLQKALHLIQFVCAPPEIS